MIQTGSSGMRVFIGLDFDCDDRHQILEVGAVPHAFSALAEPRKVGTCGS